MAGDGWMLLEMNNIELGVTLKQISRGYLARKITDVENAVNLLHFYCLITVQMLRNSYNYLLKYVAGN